MEVIIQEDYEERVIVRLAFIEKSGSFSTHKMLDRKFTYNPAGFSVGEHDEEWEELVGLMMGGKTGASSQFDDPKNLEKVFLRLVK